MNKNAETFFSEGCGRCALGGTPACKVNLWPQELALLRAIVLDCGLTEESKWGFPCYTFQKSNVLMLSVFKDCCSISFFKGALLQDTQGVLEKPGENTQADRVIRFTHVQKVKALEDTLKAYIYEAIEVEKAGLKFDYKKIEDYSIPEELQQKMEESPDLKRAFQALTPGRQKGYLLHFAAPKQSKTRISRIEKCTPQILMGKGLQD